MLVMSIIIGLIVHFQSFSEVKLFYIFSDLNSTHALILARAGSKGIPNKNMLIIDGKTILGRTIETIKASKSFANIWVSTDSFLIAMEALKCNYCLLKYILPNHN